MGVFLVLVSIFVGLASFGIFASSSTIMHEILGGVGFIVSSLFFIGGLVLSELAQLKKKLPG